MARQRCWKICSSPRGRDEKRIKALDEHRDVFVPHRGQFRYMYREPNYWFAVLHAHGTAWYSRIIPASLALGLLTDSRAVSRAIPGILARNRSSSPFLDFHWNLVCDRVTLKRQYLQAKPSRRALISSSRRSRPVPCDHLSVFCRSISTSGSQGSSSNSCLPAPFTLAKMHCRKCSRRISWDGRYRSATSVLTHMC
jgi:hypothetical protein